MSTLTLSKARRRDLAALTGLAQNDLRVMWREFTTADEARDGLMEALPRLMGLYGSAAATLAANYYDDVRDAAAVRGRFRAIPADLPDLGRTQSLAGWAVSPLYTATPDFATALTKANGGLQRIIANADRETVIGSTIQDPRAQWWVRVGSGSNCEWCAQYLDGEARSVAYDFPAHDHCNCSAEPSFD